jgi:hypothetical protein
LGACQRDTDDAEHEAGGKTGAWENAIAGELALLGGEAEGYQPYSLIKVECTAIHLQPPPDAPRPVQRGDRRSVNADDL